MGATHLLTQNVLVLNRLWQAVNICSVRRALTLLFLGHAQVVLPKEREFKTFDFDSWRSFSGDCPEEETIQSISFKIRVPKVILLLVYSRMPKKEVKFTRHNIFERDRNTCQYCGKTFERSELNLDHVVPRDQGGPTLWENIVCSCVECNTRKGNRTPQQAGMKLIRKPKRPKWQPLLQVTISKRTEDSWKHFIDLAYWHVELGEELDGS
jgi:5-methylcytosine-specific restriction endonuclease McrA